MVQQQHREPDDRKAQGYPPTPPWTLEMGRAFLKDLVANRQKAQQLAQPSPTESQSKD